MSSILFSTSELNQFLSLYILCTKYEHFAYLLIDLNTQDLSILTKIPNKSIENYLYHIDENYCLLTILRILNAYTA